jgi:hypothetical protein
MHTRSRYVIIESEHKKPSKEKRTREEKAAAAVKRSLQAGETAGGKRRF